MPSYFADRWPMPNPKAAARIPTVRVTAVLEEGLELMVAPDWNRSRYENRCSCYEKSVLKISHLSEINRAFGRREKMR